MHDGSRWRAREPPCFEPVRRGGRIGAAAGLLLVGVAAFAQPARAQRCPHAELVGPDPALLAEVRRHLVDQPSTSSSTTARCLRVVVDIRRKGDSVQLTTQRGLTNSQRRVVQSPRTAATLVASWTSEPLHDLSWAELAAEAPPEAPKRATPQTTPADTVVETAPRRPTELSRWWFAGLGTAADGGVLGGGIDIAWETGSTNWRIGPTLRVQYDEPASEPDRAGARALETAFGAHGGFVWAPGSVQLALRLGVLGAHRFIAPDAPVGPIFCSPLDPCELDEPAPPNASPYHAFTVWSEADVAIDVVLTDAIALGIRMGIAATPGFLEAGTPSVDPVRGPDDRVRALPELPQWRTSLRIGVWWMQL